MTSKVHHQVRLDSKTSILEKCRVIESSAGHQCYGRPIIKRFMNLQEMYEYQLATP